VGESRDFIGIGQIDELDMSNSQHKLNMCKSKHQKTKRRHRLVKLNFFYTLSLLSLAMVWLKIFTSQALTITSRIRVTPAGRIISKLATSASSTETSSISQAIEGPPLPPVPATSKRLFLVRHGEVINPGGDRAVFYGGEDVPLSPLGELEAIAAAQYLSQFTLSTVSSSPLSRALFGAQQVHQLQTDTSDEIFVNDGFRELARGAWCGKTREEIGLDNLRRFDACDLSVTPEGGESYPELKERVLAARDAFMNQEAFKTGTAGAIVSHLQVTRCLLSDALGMPTSKMTSLPIATASVSCVDYCMQGGAPTVHFQSFKPETGLKASLDGAN